MNTVEEIAQIRHAYYNEGKKIRAIAREQRRSRKTIRKALMSAAPRAYELKRQKAAPVLDAWKDKIDALLIESEGMPRKQRYTAKKIYDLLQAAGYGGCISTVRSASAVPAVARPWYRLWTRAAVDSSSTGQSDTMTPPAPAPRNACLKPMNSSPPDTLPMPLSQALRTTRRDAERSRR